MNPCPECGSTDRKNDEDTYALMKVVGSGVRIDATEDAPTLEGYVARLLVCGEAGHVARFATHD